MNGCKVVFWILVVVLACVPGVALAAEIHVPSGQPSIQEAIIAANNGDTIIVADGTYTGDNNKNIDFAGKAITVQSENGPQNCIIDCQGSGRGFFFHSGEGTNAVVDGLTITNGAMDMGGAIYCTSGSTPTITNCIITQNSAVHGGGLYIRNADPSFTNCVISSNSANGDGIEAWGGGIRLWGSNSTFANCLIANNYCYDYGGGVATINEPSDDLEYRPRFYNCTIVNNVADGQLGGLPGSLDVIGGGGFHSVSMDSPGGNLPDLYNCIVWGNDAGGVGDQIAGHAGLVILYNCDCANGATDIYNRTAAPLNEVHFPVGCIYVDPQFVDAGTAGVGGEGDYHLQRTSPCIDTGNDASAPAGVTTDLDGNPRFIDGDGDTVPTIDMGAYEVQPDAPLVTVTAPASPSDAPVTITYDLSDPQGDTCTVSFDYSVDSGTTWASCTAAAGDSNPQTSVTTPATGLTFIWDAFADVTGQVVDVMVRVSADDGDGHTGEDTTDEFAVVELQPPSNFNGVGCATDQIEWTWTDAVGPSAYLLEDLGGNGVALIAPGVQSHIETITGENTPATRLLRSCTSSIVPVTVEPAGTPAGATLPWNVTGYHAQYLYRAAELSNTEGVVRKIYWQRLNAGGVVTYTGVSVTVGHTTKTSLDVTFDSNFDVDGSELVRDPASYRPPEALTAREWVEINLNRGFYYNGANNLIIDIDVASGTESVAWSEIITTGTNPSLYGGPGSSIGITWDRKFFIRLDVETVISASDPATASAYTLVHDAADDDLLLELSVSGTEVVITITEPPNEHAGLTGVKIERATNDTFTQDATTLQDFTDNYSYTDADVTGGTEYWYRITFCNGDGTASAESPGESIAVLGPDTPPVAEITAPSSGTHAATILIDYDLRDYDSDPAEIAAHFSLDSGATWTTCTLAPGGDGTTPLATSLAGTSHIYAWDSDADGAGATTAELVQLRITPSDDDGVGADDITSFTVNNAPQQPPVVAITDPTTGIHGDDITIAYTLTDVNADDCDMTIEYSQDGGSSWDPCTAGTGGDGVTGLNSSPIGASYTFVWDSRTDLPDVFVNVTVQVVADDGQVGGTGSDTTAFSVDNGAQISVHFAGLPVSGTAPLTVWFSDLSVGNITSWSWDFGDGSTSTEQNPSHQFGGGTYTVSLTVTGPGGSETDTRTDYIVVSVPPPKKKKDGCSCTIDRTPTPPGELLGYFLPVLLIACAYLALRRRSPA